MEGGGCVCEGRGRRSALSCFCMALPRDLPSIKPKIKKVLLQFWGVTLFCLERTIHGDIIRLCAVVASLDPSSVTGGKLFQKIESTREPQRFILGKSLMYTQSSTFFH